MVKAKKASKRSKKGGAKAPYSERAVLAGRGRNIPRANLGTETLLAVPQSQRVTLAGTYYGTLSTGATGGYAEATFPLNNPYNGGSSFTGFAKYMQFYSKCFALGSRIMVRGVVANNATTAGLIVGVSVSTNGTSLGSAGAAIDAGLVAWEVAFNIPDRVHLQEGVDTARFLNKPRVLDDPQLFCTATAGPGQLLIAHLWVQATSATAAAINFPYVVEILTDAVFTDPIPFT